MDEFKQHHVSTYDHSDWIKGLMTVEGNCVEIKILIPEEVYGSTMKRDYPLYGLTNSEIEDVGRMYLRELYRAAMLNINNAPYYVKNKRIEKITSHLMDKNLTKNEEGAKAFAEAVTKSYRCNSKDMLKLLIQRYIDNCGISIGDRTLYYMAAEGILALTAPFKEEGLIDHLTTFCEEYDRSLDKYDICFLENKELVQYSMEEVTRNSNDPTTIALCRGIWEFMQENLLGLY